MSPRKKPTASPEARSTASRKASSKGSPEAAPKAATERSLGDAIQAAIRAGDADACRTQLAAASEEERAALSASVLKTFDLAHGLLFSRDASKSEKKLGLDETDGNRRRAILEAARIAALFTITNVAALAKYVWRSIPAKDEDVLAALERRPRAVVQAWVEQTCEHTPHRWWVGRLAVKKGLCDRPATDGYVLGMIHTAAHRFSPFVKEKTPLLDADPELLDHEIWRIFEVEGNRAVSLAGFGRVWQTMLLELVAKGRLDRARVLDATLSALARDFPQHKAGFYSRFHDALRPTPKEVAARAGTYVELLGSRISPTVTLATRVIESLPDDAPLDTAAFARAAIAAARSSRGQSTALGLLRLLHGRRADPEALDAVAVFLEHGAAEVVDAALATLEASAPSRELATRVAAIVPSVAASRRQRVAAWVAAHGGSDEATSTTKRAPADPRAPGAALATTAARSASDDSDAARALASELRASADAGPWPRVTLDDRTNPAPRLDPTRRIEPVADHAELFAVAARALEEPNDRVNYERMLDGVSRLGAPLSGLPAAAVKPLAKRAAALKGGRFHPAVGLVRKWLGGDVGSFFAFQYVNTQTFGLRRVRNVLARLEKGETRGLLSLPSTEGFFVDPIALAARMRAHDGEVDVPDLVTAILRLAPERRAEALASLGALTGVAAEAVRHALGDAVAPADPTLAFVATCIREGDPARARFRWDVSVTDAAHSWAGVELDFDGVPSLDGAPAGPPGGPPAGSPDAYPMLLATRAQGGFGAVFGDEASVRDMASLYPADRRTFLAHGARAIARNVAWSGAEWQNHVFIETLLDPDVPLDDVGLMLLAIALNAKEARESALATDVLIAAITDGRVVGPELGPPMAFFWDPVHDQVRWSQRPTAARWAKTLGAVAQTSALHAEVVRRILESFFAVPPAAPPADVSALLQLWLDLAVEAGVGIPNPEVLARYTGKAKAIAAALLAREGAVSAHAAEAKALALEGRRARAARWTAWRRGWQG